MSTETIESTFDGGAGQLFFRAWRPSGAVRGALLIVPGFNSHSGYYVSTGERLAALGLSVYTIDLRGRGRSEGERFYVDSFTSYVDDVARLARLVREREGALPLYILGHSAGGVVACLYTLDHASDLAGLICESFAFKLPAPDFALSILNGLSHVAPHAHVLKLKNADFSRDPQVVAAMNADLLIADESQPLQTVAAMVHADARLERELPDIALPLLILHGTADKATRPSGSQLFHERASSVDKTLKLYEGYYHDPLNDLGHAQVLDDIQAWLEARLA
jgi:alpha-beta hydrolase superfamily lysophospholipase